MCYHRRIRKKTRTRRVSCATVVAKRVIQKVGRIEIDSPIGVGIAATTGEPTIPLVLIPLGEPVLRALVIKDNSLTTVICLLN
ncbi:MAG: hypothetical protein DDT20_00925 [Firmicutes bacterium]|nr:hypothetical protein [Bacillota bacterium]